VIIRCANCDQVHCPRPHVNLSENVVVWEGDGVRVSRREAEVLLAILQSPGHSMGTNEIIDTVYRDSDYVDRSNVQVQVMNLRRRLSKLGISIEFRSGKYTVKWRSLSK
jgi:DNA-binding response OmpR family regulator